MFNAFLQIKCDKVEKYGTARQATHNIMKSKKDVICMLYK